MHLNWSIYSIMFILILSGSCSQRNGNEITSVFGDSLFLASVPPQPEDVWKFVIDDLKSPLWTMHDWEPKTPNNLQADLSKGVNLKKNFPDPGGHLESAYEDLLTFLSAGDVPADSDGYVIETLTKNDLEGEAFRLEINIKGCRILAGGTEGIRRGIFHLEDEMLRQRAPFLPLGTVEKEPVIQRRISRCYFAPTKHLPRMLDELMDDEDYYPVNYLNRLAHEGVNGLWLNVIYFRDLVSTKYTPEAGKDADKRLEKLRQIVDKCLRYGIKIYIFTIEPHAWGDNPPMQYDIHTLSDYPEMGGHKSRGYVNFCPFSESSQNYLYESVNKIFKAVPGLGGMINISHGERPTTCLSAVYSTDDYKGKINCPICSKKKPWEILYSSTSAMERGMHDAAPDAELISWLYMPQPQRYVTGAPYSLGEWVYDIPAHTPEGVILQFNFESGVTRQEFGKLLVGGDYWISNPGPSSRFEDIANVARENETRVSAKIQTGNSHELASVPFVPVPSLFYRKFSAMHKLGVTHTMLCWLHGGYPGIMNKLVGLLSMEPLPSDENMFLHQLASIYWKKEDVSKVVEAWKHFSDGYENYPLTNMFQYYGPMHDGPVWPLLLKPADAQLSPSWRIFSSPLKSFPPSGDRIGECIGEILTLEETVELTKRMTTSWDKGLEIFNTLEKDYLNDHERILDIGMARALGIQFRSGYNILNFYLLREKLLRMEGMERLDLLKQLEEIIHEELETDKQLIELCEKDSRLGFHSEAEGYKYFPEKIRWRMQQLRSVLDKDIPEFKKQIRDDKLLFPEYTGKEPAGVVAYAISSAGFSGSGVPEGLQWQPFSFGAENSGSQWAATYDKDTLYVIVSDKADTDKPLNSSAISSVTVRIEPRRLWSSTQYVFNTSEENRLGNRIRIMKETDKYYVIARIPFNNFWWNKEESHPIRIDVRVQKRDVGTSSWCPNNPVASRLMFGTENPADLRWLVFKN